MNLLLVAVLLIEAHDASLQNGKLGISRKYTLIELAARRLIHTADMLTFDDISPRRGWLTVSTPITTAVTYVISSA